MHTHLVVLDEFEHKTASAYVDAHLEAVGLPNRRAEREDLTTPETEPAEFAPVVALLRRVVTEPEHPEVLQHRIARPETVPVVGDGQLVSAVEGDADFARLRIDAVHEHLENGLLEPPGLTLHEVTDDVRRDLEAVSLSREIGGRRRNGERRGAGTRRGLIKGMSVVHVQSPGES